METTIIAIASRTRMLFFFACALDIAIGGIDYFASPGGRCTKPRFKISDVTHL